MHYSAQLIMEDRLLGQYYAVDASACRLMVLKALVASTNNIASVSSDDMISFIAWTAASHPASWPRTLVMALLPPQYRY